MSLSKLTSTYNIYPTVSKIYVMFLSFYTFIIIMIVQVTDSVDVNEYKQFERNKETLQRIKHYVTHSAENIRAFSDEAKLFDSIQEGKGCSSPAPAISLPENDDKEKDDSTLCDIKKILQKLLKKLNSMESSCNKRKVGSDRGPRRLLHKQDYDKRGETPVRRPRWGQWTSWSACSVSCGKGREIRWRHCAEGCDTAETEMEEKICQLPACSPGKFFGIRL